MVRAVRKNYLLPTDLVEKVDMMVKRRRYSSETEAIKEALRLLITIDAKHAERITEELDHLAEETAKHLPPEKTSGELIHEAHAEEAHWA